jgi:valyl-tRNA synthetase
MSNVSPGHDQRFMEEKVDAASNFANKIWNAARFVLMNFDQEIDFSGVDEKKYDMPEKWILGRLNTVIKEVTDNLDKFEFGIALQKIYDFIWNEFCDWYIETAKPALYDNGYPARLEVQYVLNRVMTDSLKLLHPFMPFITEEIFMNLLHEEESIMISKWPEHDPSIDYSMQENEMGFLMDKIKAVRNIRGEYKVPYSKRSKLIFSSDSEQNQRLMAKYAYLVKRLASVSEVGIADASYVPDKNMITAIVDDARLFIPLGDLVDINEEISRLKKELEKFEAELKRAQDKLSNSRFIEKAPQELVLKEREKANRYEQMIKETKERIENLK